MGADSADLTDAGVNEAPTITWKEPADGAVVQIGAPVNFVAQVMDDSSLAVDLVVDVTLTAGSMSDSVFPSAQADGTIAFTLSGLAAGKNTILLTVYDPAGALTEASLTVLVNAAPGAPVVTIEPEGPTTGQALQAVLLAPAVDAEAGPLTVAEHTFQWWRNDKEVKDQVSPKVPAGITQAGEVWTVFVWGDDGSAAGVPAEANVLIDNGAPGPAEIAIKPEDANVASTVECAITKPSVDPEGDPVQYLVRWTLGGVALPEAGTATTVMLATIESGAWKQVVNVKAGDVLGCRVNPTDGASVGVLAEASVKLGGFDACASGYSGCPPNAACTDTDAAEAVCSCLPGYGGPEGTCDDIDECLASTTQCAANSHCFNYEGNYGCVCEPGWQGDGKDGSGCKDVDECAEGLAVCDAAAECTNTMGDYGCVCQPGYSGDGKTCSDVNECANDPAPCDLNAACTNTNGAYTCACKAGWSGDGKTCVDVDECSTGAYTCNPHASCANMNGSYLCKCDVGWLGDGLQCEDVDECKSKADDCHPQATCSNTSGGYQCACKAGWTGQGVGVLGCADVNECQTNQFVCAATAKCVNLDGSYGCKCEFGWVGDGKVCEDLDECKLGTATCHVAAICSNTDGGYTCSCKPGWTGDGKSCTPEGS